MTELKTVVHKLFEQFSIYFPDTPFTVQYWTGEATQYGDGPPIFILYLHNLKGVKHALSNGTLGFGEAYMAGDIDVAGDLQSLLKFQTATGGISLKLSFWEKLRVILSTFFARNTITGAKNNIPYPYDLGNDFYRLWLDTSMTYSCAYFRTPYDTLEEAQRNKYELICRKLRLEPSQTLIDIGCGWGGMMFYAAENYGVTCVGYTLCERQYGWLQQQIKQRGLQNQISVFLKDYREAHDSFDHFVSIGMMEHVGKSFIKTYFKTVQRLLKPGGTGVLQTISQNTPYTPHLWVEKYIFPNGYIPCLAEIAQAMDTMNLNPFDIEDLRLHYSETINHWQQRFNQYRPEIENLYGQKFARMWHLYLNGGATVFRYGKCRLFQITFTNGLNNALPRTRDYLYAQPTLMPCLSPPLQRSSLYDDVGQKLSG